MAESTAKRNGKPSDPRMNALDLAVLAKQAIHDLTGFPPESVTALQWDGEAWLATVDVCELERVPSTSDVMASYVVQLDENGGLLGYKRTRRYFRSQAEEG
jgi:hypothetical protein